MKVPIVTFRGKRKRGYTSTLAFEGDAANLKMPPPRIRIDLDIFNRKDFIWASAFYDSIAAVLCLVAGTMILGSIVRFRAARAASH